MSLLVCPSCRKEFPLGTDTAAGPLPCQTCRVPLTASSSTAIRETVSVREGEPEISLCPRCGQPVSSLCPTCPHCDAPLSDKRHPLLVFVVIGGITHLCFIVFLLGKLFWPFENVANSTLLAGYAVIITVLFGVGALIEWADQAVGDRVTVKRLILCTMEASGILATIGGICVSAAFLLGLAALIAFLLVCGAGFSAP